MRKKKTKEIRFLSDVVVYILAALGPYARFSGKTPEIHDAFYQMSKKEEFAPLFKDIVFLNEEYAPWSELIFNRIDSLQLSGLLNIICAGNDVLYEVTPNLAAKDPAGLFSKKEIELIKKAAVEFEKSVEVKRINVCKCPTPDCSKIGLTD